MFYSYKNPRNPGHVKVAIIPARGGSKRILGKNTRNFLGTPILGRCITQLAESRIFDRIIVSTEDDAIRDIALSFGAEVPFRRPSDIASDFASTKEVINHGITNLGLSDQTIVACLYPTSVFWKSSDLDLAINLVESGPWEYVLAAATIVPSPLRSFGINPSQGVEMFHPEYWDYRSQDLPESYFDTGQFYVALGATWKSTSIIFSERSTAVILDHAKVVDINVESDWEKAEKIFSEYFSSERGTQNDF